MRSRFLLRNFYPALFLICSLTFFFGCENITSIDSTETESFQSQEFSNLAASKKKGNKSKGSSSQSSQTQLESLDFCTEQSFQFRAGQHHNAGSVVIKIEDNSIHVTYLAQNGWKLQKTHMHIAKDLNGVPTTGSGSPKMGHFSYSESHNNITIYTYSVSFDDAGLTPGDTFVVVTHAEVTNGSGGGETAFGGNFKAPGSRWWYYTGGYVEECEEPVTSTSRRMTRGSRW